MATGPTSQRAWRAACPNCGAPVEFRSAASASAVCSFCRSTLLRDGEALARIGQSAELFDDFSALQLGAAGRFQGQAFTLVGRLQYAYEGGTWNEWHALFDSGRSGWLSEDNGRFVLGFEAPLEGEVPAPEELVPGERRLVANRAWNVASVTRARLLAAEGELPHPPMLQGEFSVADLRNEHDEVGTLDWSEPARPQWSVGRPVALSELAMQGLREGSEKTLGARSLPCPSCGAALEIRLDSTQSVVCGQCKAVVDVSGQDAAGALPHFAQDGEHRLEPLIPLGTVGTLAVTAGRPLKWQVVGYLERCDLPEPGDDESEQTFWREYLLWHATEGFAFLVDTEEGWSVVRPLTGVPSTRGDRAEWQGVRYARRWEYNARVTYVLGEFYWRVKRGETARVADYEAQDQRLSREQSAGEVTWSQGRTLAAAEVADAFAIAPSARKALQRDAAPTAAGAGGLVKGLVVLAVLIVIVLAVSRCDDDRDCNEVRATYGEASNEYQQCRRSGGGTRTGGSSFGGFSSGGSHK